MPRQQPVVEAAISTRSIGDAAAATGTRRVARLGVGIVRGSMVRIKDRELVGRNGDVDREHESEGEVMWLGT
jgi:hypothetical protein